MRVSRAFLQHRGTVELNQVTPTTIGELYSIERLYVALRIHDPSHDVYCGLRVWVVGEKLGPFRNHSVCDEECLALFHQAERY